MPRRPAVQLLVLFTALLLLPSVGAGAAEREGDAPSVVRVAYTNGRVAGVTAADGSGPTEPIGTEAGVAATAWSPGGRSLALVEGQPYGSGPLRVADPGDGSTSHVLLDDAREPVWSDDGLLAALQGDAVAVLDPPGPDRRPGPLLTPIPSGPNSAIRDLRWRPGGGVWAVIGLEGPNGEDVFLGSPGSAPDTLVNLTGAAVRASSFAWLPDGSGLVVAGRPGEDQTGPPALYRIGLDGSTARVADLPSDRLLGIAPDGRSVVLEVVVERPSTRVAHLSLVDVATGVARPLVTDPQIVRDRIRDLAWLPDGSSLMVSAIQYDSGGDDFGYVTVVDAATGEPTASQPFPDDGTPTELSANGDILVDVDDSAVRRLGGGSRFGTAAAIAADARPDATTVVLARGDDYADALAGAPLAALLDAPLLLSGRDELPAETAARLGRPEVTDIVLLGGEVALSDELVASLGQAHTIDRVAGPTRFETAVAVRNRVVALGGDAGAAYAVQGRDADPARGWPDAVAVAPVAAAQGRPILLTDTNALPDATAAALDDATVTVVGGRVAISDAVRDELAVRTGHPVQRIAGGDRYATSVGVARAALAAGVGTEEVWLATGGAFPDALAAGPAAAVSGGVVLLAGGEELGPEAVDFLTEHPGVRRIVAVGDAGVVAPPLPVQAAALALR